MGKIVNSLDELKSIIEREKAAGKRVVFGNGCFDIVHVGHVRYLKGAKELGDVLVVAVNDDASVTSLGKRKEVVTPAAERAEIISAIDCVDYVILFRDPTVENLLDTLNHTYTPRERTTTRKTSPSAPSSCPTGERSP
jgi:D-beta-D-heptose 7-phosphate kinase/D-beta-D-heptose 1-phosphate adenosyltransferase